MSPTHRTPHPKPEPSCTQRPVTRRTAALLAALLLGASCGGDVGTPTTADPVPPGPTTPPPATQPPALPALPGLPDPGDDDRLTETAEATRLALLAAARAADWDALARHLPGEDFAASFGGSSDPIAYYRSHPDDIMAVIIRLLEGDRGRVGVRLTVWPELHARDPFTILPEERADLVSVYGEGVVANWEAAGAYLGWRLGIDDDGTWRFLIAGD
jgi:hypothetical protein